MTFISIIGNWFNSDIPKNYYPTYQKDALFYGSQRLGKLDR